VRLTGAVPISDAQFAVIRQGAFLNTLITTAAVLMILWLALRSLRIIAAVFFARQRPRGARSAKREPDLVEGAST
jgi:uncharacterized protein